MQTDTQHTGWSQAEDALLFAAVSEARAQNAALKTVFASVAEKTGRKPNSIRNYYYARAKADPALAAGACCAFVPFTESEIDALLRTVLSAQAKGISVRACTLEMGGGDMRRMLRYQNKYRALLKSDPARVQNTLRALRAEGVPAFDPYAAARISRAGRPRKRQENLVEVLSGVVRDLDRVEGLDVTAFFESLGALAVSANRGASRPRGEESEAYNARIRALENECRAARERFETLLSLYRQLIRVNREFLGMTGVSKMSSLTGYISSLSQNVEDCERLLPGLM